MTKYKIVIFITAFFCVLSSSLYAGDESARDPALLDMLVAGALENNAELRTAAIKLRSAEAALEAAAPWRSASLQLESSLRGSLAEEAAAVSVPSWAASASLPLASWLSLAAGVDSSGKDVLNGNLSLNLQPFAKEDTSAELSYRSALLEYRTCLRSNLLTIRKDIRELIVLEAERQYREAELTAAESEYQSKLVKAESGQLMHADVLSAIAELGSTELSHDEFLSAYNEFLDDLVRQLDTALDKLPDTDMIFELDTLYEHKALEALMDETEWLVYSESYQKSLLDAESAELSADKARILPDFSLKGELSSVIPDAADGSWSVSASIRIPLDVFYNDAYGAAVDMALLKQDSALNSRNEALADYERKQTELSRYTRSLERIDTAFEAAQLMLEQVTVLHSMGQTSDASLLAAEAELLHTKWQRLQIWQSYRSVLDELSQFIDK